MRDEVPRSPAAVRRTYETIAADFDRTRSRPWPAVERFVEDGPRAGWALDLGCGNGRHALTLADRVERVVGLDLSRRLLAIADRALAGQGVALVEGTATALPLRGDAFTTALYIATLHHLPDRSTRVASLDELSRVLCPGAAALVSVWSVSHERFDADTAHDAVVDWTLPSGEVVPRFYHLYDRDAFDAELADSALAVRRRWLEAGNLYAVVASPK